MLDTLEATQSIREKGGRVTPQKVAVIEAIYHSNSHPTIDEIFDEVSSSQPSLSKKTVYQIVNDLADMKIVSLVDVGTGQMRVDPTVETEHDHFVCTSCRKVFDIDRKEPVGLSNKAKSFGLIEQVEVVYRGVCNECKEQ